MKICINKIMTQKGLSLIELMIAMTIGIIMVGGALYVYTNARSAFQVNENYSRMQENGRYALSLMEPDIQLAGFWGNHNDFVDIQGSALDRDPADIVAVGNDCAPNFVVQFDQYVQGFDNIDSASNPPNLPCLPPRYINQTDMIVARRTGTNPVANADLANDQIYLRSSEAPQATVFVGNTIPLGLPVNSENFPVITHAYYISSYTAGNTSQNDNIPSLRRVQLAPGPAMVDSEIIPGVENMQIQYGISPIASTAVRAYVSASNPLMTSPATAVRAVRVWLLMRADKPEAGYTDDQPYVLGDQVVPAPGDMFRRIVISKTIFLRNPSI